MRKRPILTLEHIKQVMDRDIIIGSDISRDGYRISFAFNPYANEFRINHDNQGVVASSGPDATHEMLDIYNEL